MGKKIANVITTVLLIVLVLLVLAMFAMRLTGRTPSILGYQVYRVFTDSMEPELKIGDIILVKSVSAEEIKKGDIVTYNSLQGEIRGQSITHRIVSDPEVVGGRYIYQTKGDALGAVPDPQITYDQVEGKYICKIPVIDKLYSFFLTSYGLITIIAVIVVMFGYEMISLIASNKALDKIDDEIFGSEELEDKI